MLSANSQTLDTSSIIRPYWTGTIATELPNADLVTGEDSVDASIVAVNTADVMRFDCRLLGPSIETGIVPCNASLRLPQDLYQESITGLLELQARSVDGVGNLGSWASARWLSGTILV